MTLALPLKYENSCILDANDETIAMYVYREHGAEIVAAVNGNDPSSLLEVWQDERIIHSVPFSELETRFAQLYISHAKLLEAAKEYRYTLLCRSLPIPDDLEATITAAEAAP
jgi:hypothetical protein